MKPTDPALPDLPRLVMRRAVWVAACAWLLALALGLTRAARDIDQELAAASSLSAIAAGLSRMAIWDDARAIGELEQLQRSAPLRHLRVAAGHEVSGGVNPARLQAVGAAAGEAAGEALAPREFAVMHLLVQGLSVEQIGQRPGLSGKTASNDQTSIRHKLGVATSIDLLRHAQERGWKLP